jgi:hypothetical protein
MADEKMNDAGELSRIFFAAEDIDHISKPPLFLSHYEADLAHLRQQPITIVEVGNYKGHFLHALERYFPFAQIIGLDIQNRTLGERVKLFECNQGDGDAIARILSEHMPDGVDVLFDDASHVGSWSHSLFRATFDRWLKPGGYYYIEDWATGYWPDWPDGMDYKRPVFLDEQTYHFHRRITSHDAGMVGFVKTLVDEVCSPGWRPPAPTNIESVTFVNGIVKLRKSRSA